MAKAKGDKALTSVVKPAERKRRRWDLQAADDEGPSKKSLWDQAEVRRSPLLEIVR